MLSLKLFAATVFFSMFFTSTLIAQRQYECEIACNEFLAFDSILFFQEVCQDDVLDKNDGLNTNLFGSYFDEFPQIRNDMLSALHFYPELANVNIEFKYKPIKQTMNSRPLVGNIFRTKDNRKYTIIVNNNLGRIKGLPFEKLSFNIRSGWLGHELAHICSYEKMSNWQTFWFSLKYVFSKKYLRKVERFTDYTTVEHGLAYPLYDGTDYLCKNKDISEKYRKHAIINSLSLEEIKCFWCHYSCDKILISAENPDTEKH